MVKLKILTALWSVLTFALFLGLSGVHAQTLDTRGNIEVKGETNVLRDITDGTQDLVNDVNETSDRILNNLEDDVNTATENIVDTTTTVESAFDLEITSGDLSRTDVDIDREVSSAVQVQSKAEFESFVRNLIYTDERVRKISSDEESVSLIYAEEGELLGFIPITLGVKTRVDAEGNVDVDYPWYSFLTTKASENLKTILEEEIEVYFAGNENEEVETSVSTSTATTTSVDTEVGGEFTLRERAEVLEIIYSAVESALSSEIETDATLEGGTEAEVSL